MIISKPINTESTIMRIVSSLAHRDMADSVTLESCLYNDLGLDSLNMMELCVALEGVFKVRFNQGMGEIRTVRDIVVLVENGSAGCNRNVEYKTEDYPLSKKEIHLWSLKRFMRFSQLAWSFDVTGLENIPDAGSYILCPNHQSHFDSLWIWSALEAKNIDFNKICCLAKHEHTNSSISRFGLTLLGGIPVDRTGDTTPALKRGLECIQKGYTMLIHPEGTRTTDGKIHGFKFGAANLAIEANVPLIPVRIEGAWNIFPPHRKLPKILRLKGRYPLKITFGKPIKPEGKSVEELTLILQKAVENLGEAI